MTYNPEVHHRRSFRLKGYDYSHLGAYFVTICAYKKGCIFEDEAIKQIIVDEWLQLPAQFQGAGVDEFMVMPNHVHGIICIEPVVAGLALPTHKSGLALPGNKPKAEKGGPRPAPTLGDMVCAFKSKATVNVNRLRNRTGSPVWQRNYYEHVVRSGDELNRIRQYIISNPVKWEEDIENPMNWQKEKAKDYYDEIYSYKER